MGKNERRFRVSIPPRIEAPRDEAVIVYFEHLEGKGCSESTRKNRATALRRFWGFFRLGNGANYRDITAADLDGYRTHLYELGLADTTVMQEMATLRGFFAYLQDTNRIFISPAAGMVLRVPRKSIRHTPSVEDVRNLLDHPKITTRAGLRDRAFMELVYSSAARLDEAVTLTLYHIDLDGGTVRLFGKDKKERLAPLGKTAVEWLKEYLKLRANLLDGRDEDALWLNVKGGVLSYQGAEKIVLKHAKGAGIKAFSSHALRRACATHMLHNGASPVLLQQLLGHTSLKYLARYLNVSMKDMEEMHKNSKLGG